MSLNEFRATGAISGGLPSLPEVYRSVPVEKKFGWRRMLAFSGPAFLVSVGYMDPGNWATDLGAGSRFGYKLLWVILASNLIAILLQTLCARLGLATGRDLAQACREYYKKPAAIALWLLCEVAIIACDLAEVIGSAVALQLLLGIDLIYGVLITGFDVLILLGLMRFGFRKIEAIVLTLVATVTGCFALEMFLSKPAIGAIIHGTLTPSALSGESLLLALGILGATVMPHNLYLHSSLVQTRATERTPAGIREAIHYNTWDTVIALGAAFFVNAAILILAAAVFHPHGKIVEEFKDAPMLLRPLLGGAAATAFSVALLASGQSSTITGTLAGQIVMEGFLRFRIPAWMRRLITRGIALIPAILIVVATGGRGTIDLVVLSQVVLSMQLPFAIFPLISFTSDRRRMGEFTSPLWLKASGYAICFIIVALNGWLLVQEATKRFGKAGIAGLSVLVLAGLAFALWVRFGYREPPKVAESK